MPILDKKHLFFLKIVIKKFSNILKFDKKWIVYNISFIIFFNYIINRLNMFLFTYNFNNKW